MRVLRGIIGIALVLGLLVAIGAFGWATHFPEDPRLTAAREWPVVGPLAAWVQDTYLPPAEDTGGEESPATLTYRPEDPRRHDAEPDTWVSPEMPLRRAPSEDAAIILRFDRYANVPLLEERDGWRRVRWQDHVGWLPPAPDDEPILGRAVDPPGPLMARPADPQRLESARRQLGMERTERKLGPYPFYTDSTNQVLHDRLARLAVQMDEVYARRFGLRPTGTPAESVVLFEREADYRRFQNQSASLVGLNAAGHAGWGMAALYRGEQSMDAVAAVFVHELTHLINRRAIGPALPLWLNEGLAETLSTSRLSPWGGLDPETWGGSRQQLGNRTHFSGEWVARQNLQNAALDGSLPPLERVIGLDDETFQRGAPQPGLFYALAGSFFRYLLDGDDRRHRAAFHRFLASVAQGGAPTADALRRHLGVAWSELDGDYRKWLLAQAPSGT